MDLKQSLSPSQRHQNFWANIISGGASKLADQLASPSLVLPWIFSVLNAPNYLIGFLVPIRRTGALLPQLLISSRLQNYPNKKSFWIIGALAQATAVSLMAFSVLLFDQLTAGLLLIVSLTVFSLARSLGSLSFKDVLAKSVLKPKRGQLLAGRTILGGTISLISSLLLRQYFTGITSKHPYVLLLFIASISWIISALLFSLITEVPGDTAPIQDFISQIQQGWHMFTQNQSFQRYVFSRLAFISISLSLPFYTLLGKRLLGNVFSVLMLLIIVKGISEIISSFFWGKLVDWSSKNVMISIGFISFLSATLIALATIATDFQIILTLVPLSLIVAADRGIKIARDTYLINATQNDTRPLYTAVSNTLTGTLALLAGSIGILTQFTSLPVIIIILGIFGLVGSYFSFKLPFPASFS